MLPSDLDYGAPRVKGFDPETGVGSPEGRHGNFGGSKVSNVTPISLLPTNFAQVPREAYTGENAVSRRSGLVTSHVDEGQAQALAAMGRTLQHRRGHTARHLQAKRLRR